MALLLLAIIYVVFVSLGLPDGVMGSAWPAMHTALSVPIGFGGVLTVLGVAMTTFSSLMTTRLVRWLGIGRLIALSVLLTSVGLIGLSHASHIIIVFLFSIPLGLGAGAIDSALNHYVAEHYKAHHMNWLHAFWGIGATLGPLLFAGAFAASGNWHSGFMVLGIAQGAIFVLLLASLRLWENGKPVTITSHSPDSLSLIQV